MSDPSSDARRLLSVAARVHIPQLGGTAIALKTTGTEPTRQPAYDLRKHKREVSTRYLKRISAGLSFNEDVVKERGPETIPYRSDELKRLFRAETKRKPPSTHQRKWAPRPSSHFRCMTKDPNREEGIGIEIPPPLPSPPSRLGYRRKTPQRSIKSSEASPVVTDRWEKYILTRLSDSAADLLIRKSSEEKDALARFMENYRKEGRRVYERVKPKENPEEERSNTPKENDTKTKKVANFRDDWLAKTKIVAGGVGNDLIRFDNGDEYEKVLTVSYPENPKTYSEKTRRLASPAELIKGHRRWKDFPAPVEDDRETLWRMPEPRGLYGEKRRLHESEVSLLGSSTASQIVDEWHARYNLKVKWTATTTEQLFKDLTSVNDYVRLAAVSACAYAKRLNIKSESESPLPIRLLNLVKSALSDSNDTVKLGAAVTLFTLNLPCVEGQAVLYNALLKGQESDKWTAVQCLTGAHVCDEVIVRELFSRLNGLDDAQHFKASALLEKLSRNSSLVHFLTGEQLNSNCWQARLNSCKLVPLLHGSINKDLTQKLLDLMWHDWSSGVRQAAAQALGKTGKGKLVHDELREKLKNGKESEKIDALRKIRGLGLMTGRMLPSFLACFRSDYVSVKLHATKAASELLIKDIKVIEALMKQMDDDLWKMKAHAIQALGLIGVNHPGLIDKLLWSMRFEKHPFVRAEACRSLQLIRRTMDNEDDDDTDARIIPVLRDLLTVDSDPNVQREAAAALRALGQEPTADQSMTTLVREEVKKLGTRGRIITRIVEREIAETLEQHRRRLLRASPSPSPSRRWRQATRTTVLSSWIRGTDDGEASDDENSELIPLKDEEDVDEDETTERGQATTATTTTTRELRDGRVTMQSTALSHYLDL